MIDAGFGRSAAERLSAAGLAVEHLETDAGHSLPPESILPARDLIAGALAGPAGPPRA